MSYIRKYTIGFKEFTFDIYEYNYLGTETALTAGTPACVHQWDEDDIQAPVRGSSLDINVIGVNLLDFYSDNDQQFLGKLFKGSQLLFSGFLVQDDCSQPVDDLVHQVTLSFTDNLGLLKDVDFGDAILQPQIFYYKPLAGTDITTSGTTLNYRFAFNAGDTIEFASIGTYIIASGSGSTWTTLTTLPTLSSGTFYPIYIRSSPTASKIPLFTVIQACLRKTGISLPIDVYANLKENNQTGYIHFLEETLIAKESLLKSEREYLDCYAVLENILRDLNCSIFQAEGKWVITRIFEQAPAVYHYDADFYFINSEPSAIAEITTGYNQNVFPEYGLNQRILRPYDLVKNTFNYENAYQLLKNADIKDLGALITSYMSGVNTVNEYNMPYWYDSPLAPAGSDLRIRIILDPLGNEIERYITVDGDASMSSPIEATAGDIIEFSFTIKNEAGALPIPNNLVFVIQITDGVNTKYANADGTWKNTLGFSVSSNNTYENFTPITLKTGRIPFNGLVRVFLTLISGKTYYNDLRFKYESFINESTKIIGQYHTQNQSIIVKNKQDESLNIDDAPRNFIKGCLFLPYLTGLIQTRTSIWSIGSSISDKRLGEIITNEVKQWRSEPRTILEGTLHGKSANDIVVNLLNNFNNISFPSAKFKFGRLSINYAEWSIDGTMYEVYKDGFPPAATDYNFTYIYDTK